MNYKQCVHRIRLKQIKPSETVKYLGEASPAKFQLNPHWNQTRHGTRLV